VSHLFQVTVQTFPLAVNEDLVVRHSNDQASWDAFIVKVNASLNSLDLEFRHLHDEATGREMYALVRLP
jgi:hypothetical protein